MGLNSDWPHQVDVLLRDDRATGLRMGRAQTESVAATAVRCRVHERPPAEDLDHGREEVRHTHRVHFKAARDLTTAHVLRWADPDTGATLYLRVKGTRRPRDRGMPYVAFCLRNESAES